jgi:uncharacterized protein (TIGR02145 family)
LHVGYFFLHAAAEHPFRPRLVEFVRVPVFFISPVALDVERAGKAAWEQAGLQGKPACCYYENDEKNLKKYGRLYNGYAVNDPRGLAPAGWHIPPDSEWAMLIHYLGGDEEAGDRMKDNKLWKGSENANKDRYQNGDFAYLIGSANFWSATGVDSTHANRIRILWMISDVQPEEDHKANGCSVRCLKD